MASLQRDENHVAVLGAVTDDANLTVSPLKVDPSTGRLKVSAIIAGGTVTSINGDSTAAQTLAVGTSGTDFAIVDNGTGTHTFNLPTASASNRGALSTTDWSTFNGKVSGPVSSTDNAIPRFNGTTGKVIQNSSVFINSSGQLSIGTASASYPLHVAGNSSSVSTAAIIELEDTSGNGGSRNWAIGNSMAANFGDLSFAVGSTSGGVPTGSGVKMTLNLSGSLGIGTTSPDRLLHPELSDAGTNAVVYPFRMSHITSGTATTGFGVGNEFELENASGTNRVAATEEVTFTDAVDATEDATYTLKLIRAGSLTSAMAVTSVGAMTLDGVAVPTISSTNTLTNKRITRRVVTVTQSATPTINTDNTDVAYITGLAQAVTSFTTNLTGTPVNGDCLIIDITDNGTARALTFGTSFEASGTVPLPTTTVISTKLTIGFRWNTATSKWTCVAVA